MQNQSIRGRAVYIHQPRRWARLQQEISSQNFSTEILRTVLFRKLLDRIDCPIQGVRICASLA